MRDLKNEELVAVAGGRGINIGDIGSGNSTGNGNSIDAGGNSLSADGNGSGNSGDGKVFVWSVESAIRIQTREQDEAAL